MIVNKFLHSLKMFPEKEEVLIKPPTIRKKQSSLTSFLVVVLVL